MEPRSAGPQGVSGHFGLSPQTELGSWFASLRGAGGGEEWPMNQDFILGRLSDLMGWDDDTSRSEFAWLGLMSRMKYDSYQDFLAGMRFIESLADWLQQFTAAERSAAYALVRHSLVYVSTAELNHLVELFYPETVQWRLQNAVASRLEIPPY